MRYARFCAAIIIGAGACGGSPSTPAADGPVTPEAEAASAARTGGAAAWIREHFAGAPVVAGEITMRTRVETPALVDTANACCAKYAFDVVEEADPVDPQIGFVDVTIHD